MSLTAYLVILAIVVVVVLAAIAAHLQYRVYQLQRKRAAEQAQQDEVSRQQRERINTSIRILAQAVHGEELSLTEASIRISGLLDSLEVDEEVRREFSAFYQLRELTAHIPILEAWQKLDRKTQVRFDVERLQHEASYRDFVLDAAERIKTRSFS